MDLTTARLKICTPDPLKRVYLWGKQNLLSFYGGIVQLVELEICNLQTTEHNRLLPPAEVT